MAGERQIEDDEGLMLRRIAPGQRIVPVTPSDSADNCGKNATIRIMTGGVIKFIPHGNSDSEVITWDVADGEIIDVIVRRVLSTGTTASDIYAIS